MCLLITCHRQSWQKYTYSPRRKNYRYLCKKSRSVSTSSCNDSEKMEALKRLFFTLECRCFLSVSPSCMFYVCRLVSSLGWDTHRWIHQEVVHIRNQSWSQENCTVWCNIKIICKRVEPEWKFIAEAGKVKGWQSLNTPSTWNEYLRTILTIFVATFGKQLGVLYWIGVRACWVMKGFMILLGIILNASAFPGKTLVYLDN